jgi:hypothetical protein
MLVIIDSYPACALVGGAEYAAHTVNFSDDKNGWVSLTASCLSEANIICFLYISELRKSRA